MKDKTLYWILGIIAAYFVIRFVMNQIAGKKQTAGNKAVTIGYTDKNGLYHYNGHVEGKKGGICFACGGTVYYKKVLNSANPEGGYILRRVCSNPNCETHQLYY